MHFDGESVVTPTNQVAETDGEQDLGRCVIVPALVEQLVLIELRG